MIINSEGREIKCSLGILKVQFVLLVEAITWEFFNFKGIFPQIFDPENAKVAAP